MSERAVETRQGAIDWLVDKFFVDRLSSVKVAPDALAGPGNSLTVNQIYNLAMSDENFQAMAEGNADTLKYGSTSEVELSIVYRLCFLTAGDLSKTMEVARRLPIYDLAKKERGTSKWERSIPNYSWKRAFESCGGRYHRTVEDMFGSTITKASREEYETRINKENNFDNLLTLAGEIHNSTLPESHKDRLIKNIASRARISLKSLRSDLSSASVEDEDSIHFAAAKRTIETIGLENILFCDESIYLWRSTGVWQEADDREIKKVIHSKAPTSRLTQSAASSILDLIKTEVYRPNHRFNLNRKGINCLNGILQWKGSNWDLKPHNKADYPTSQIPIAYNPEARAHRFEQFLREITEPDEQADKKILLICEALGYCLSTSTEYEAFFFLIGPGANGKSVLMAVISKLVGPDNVAAVQPSQLSNKFQRAHLNNRLANLVTEIEIGHQVDDAALKAIASGEPTTVERKYQAPFEMRPYATCFFGTNHLPHTRDFSDALQRRAYIIGFNRVFAPEEQDKQLIGKLSKELPGILNLALDGLARLYTQGGFTAVQEVEDARKAWQLESDQVAQFIEGECDLSPENRARLKDFYGIYRHWGSESGITRLLSQKNFVNRLKRFGVNSTKGTGGYFFLTGVKIRDGHGINIFDGGSSETV